MDLLHLGEARQQPKYFFQKIFNGNKNVLIFMHRQKRQNFSLLCIFTRRKPHDKARSKNREIFGTVFKIKKDRALTTFFLENRRKEAFVLQLGGYCFPPIGKGFKRKKTQMKRGTAENQAGGGTAHKSNCLWISSYGENRMTKQGQNKKGQGVDYFLLENRRKEDIFFLFCNGQDIVFSSSQ